MCDYRINETPCCKDIPNENLDDGSEGNWVSRKRTFYCRRAHHIDNPDNRVFTCETGRPWTPYPFPRCLRGCS